MKHIPLKHNENNDLKVGISAYYVWGILGWHDIKQRYRRSVIGPFWFTLSTLVMVGVLGILYSELLGQDITDYLPYLGVGLVVWQYISTNINEACSTFINSSYVIKQVRLPMTVHIVRVCWRNLVILMHSLPVVILIMIAMGNKLSLEIFLVIPGIVLLFLNLIWMSIISAILCTRYRDVLPIVGNIIQVAFFFTPIMWSKDLLKDRAWAADINIFHHMIEIIRAPILGQQVVLISWVINVVMIVVGFTLAQVLLKKYRNRIAYWL
ncbi:ABC transporter permease [Vibrio sp. V09_P4A23P171]|uniref:ABC transporter permease n=1 Tax=Vibrio sp. V09_P4A23P171 TaxID=1938664 RepID=UPI000B8E2DA5|nr:ABC transporter permease [Vibrio sp. V09_P4A23P171]OXX36966.1 ABC transporter permease [Vibrio sp. V09_P4A23P171]